MCRKRNSFYLVILFIVPFASPESNEDQSRSQEATSSSNSLSESVHDLILNNGEESANLFAPFESSSDYFPGFPYFPDFGEIFRISRTTTPPPPFSFPEYVADVFPDREVEARRPPRPAPSGTRTKVSKQNPNEPREKPKLIKNKTPNKSRDYPKIFRFTSDRVNLEEFDMKKKMNENYVTLTKGDELDSDQVKRNKFLILHGGVFEIGRSGRISLFPSSSEVYET